MGKYNPLFTPMYVGNVKLRNRFALMPTGIHSHRLVNPDGSFTEDAIRYYKRIAEGGIGLIIISAMMVQSTFDTPRGSGASLNKAGDAYIEQSKKTD